VGDLHRRRAVARDHPDRPDRAAPAPGVLHGSQPRRLPRDDRAVGASGRGAGDAGRTRRTGGAGRQREPAGLGDHHGRRRHLAAHAVLPPAWRVRQVRAARGPRARARPRLHVHDARLSGSVLDRARHRGRRLRQGRLGGRRVRQRSRAGGLPQPRRPVRRGPARHPGAQGRAGLRRGVRRSRRRHLARSVRHDVSSRQLLDDPWVPPPRPAIPPDWIEHRAAQPHPSIAYAWVEILLEATERDIQRVHAPRPTIISRQMARAVVPPVDRPGHRRRRPRHPGPDLPAVPQPVARSDADPRQVRRHQARHAVARGEGQAITRLQLPVESSRKMPPPRFRELSADEIQLVVTELQK
jgi:hypothetical protein